MSLFNAISHKIILKERLYEKELLIFYDFMRGRIFKLSFLLRTLFSSMQISPIPENHVGLSNGNPADDTAAHAIANLVLVILVHTN